MMRGQLRKSTREARFFRNLIQTENKGGIALLLERARCQLFFQGKPMDNGFSGEGRCGKPSDHMGYNAPTAGSFRGDSCRNLRHSLPFRK